MEVGERAAILEKVIAYFLRRGYCVASRSDVSAKLVKPKWFSKGQILHVFITEEGKVRLTDPSGRVVHPKAKRTRQRRELAHKPTSPDVRKASSSVIAARSKATVGVIALLTVVACVFSLTVFAAFSNWREWIPTPAREPLPAISPENVEQVGLLRTIDVVGHTTLAYNDVYSVAFSPDAQTIASGSLDGVVRLWRVADGRLLYALAGHEGVANRVVFSPDGQLLASASPMDNTARLWHLSNRPSPLRTLHHIDWVWCVAFSPDGEILASGSWDTTVRLWRVADGTVFRALRGHTEAIYSVAFSPDGLLLASGSQDGTVRLWRVADGALERVMRAHAEVRSVAFSPNGELLASAGIGGGIRLWRVADGTLVRVLEGQVGQVEEIAFSPDGGILVADSIGGASLWRVADGALLRTLEVGSGIVYSVAFSPDGQILATGSEDGAIRLWGVAGP